MSAPEYSIPTGGAITLTAATAKSILGAKAHANSGLLLRKLKIGVLGVSASAVPVLIEICYSTWATNSPGTNSTSVTPVQKNGRVLTAGFTAGKTWTAEPTTLTVIDEATIAAFMGVLWYDIPLGDEYDCALAEGWAIRANAPAGVDIRATMSVSRC